MATRHVWRVVRGLLPTSLRDLTMWVLGSYGFVREIEGEARIEVLLICVGLVAGAGVANAVPLLLNRQEPTTIEQQSHSQRPSQQQPRSPSSPES